MLIIQCFLIIISWSLIERTVEEEASGPGRVQERIRESIELKNPNEISNEYLIMMHMTQDLKKFDGKDKGSSHGDDLIRKSRSLPQEQAHKRLHRSIFNKQNLLEPQLTQTGQWYGDHTPFWYYNAVPSAFVSGVPVMFTQFDGIAETSTPSSMPSRNCKFHLVSEDDPPAWVILVPTFLLSEPLSSECVEKLPYLADEIGISEVGLSSKPGRALLHIYTPDETPALKLYYKLAKYKPIYLGHTHDKPKHYSRILIHGLPIDVPVPVIERACAEQFPEKKKGVDYNVTGEYVGTMLTKAWIDTADWNMKKELLHGGGLKMFSDKLAFRCSLERRNGPKPQLKPEQVTHVIRPTLQ